MDEIWGPNVTDKESVLSLARIAADAYVLERSDPEWQDVGCGFNYTEDFGWDNDGLRGHIFADTQNETVIIGIKGTSPGKCMSWSSMYSTYPKINNSSVRRHRDHHERQDQR